MPNQIVTLDNSPRQTWKVALNVDDGTLILSVALNFNEIAQYWVMTISDSNGNLLLDSVPYVTSSSLGSNILRQFSYLAIGSATLVNVSGISQDHPDSTDLGSDWHLIWGDTASLAEAVA